MTKILIIGPYAPHGQVGAIRVLSLSRYLVKQGFDVSVLCLSRRSLERLAPNELCAEIPDGVNVITYDLGIDGSSILKKSIRQINAFRQELAQLLSREKFDAALISGGPFYTFPASNLFRQYAVPYIVDYRDLHVSCREKRKHGFSISTAKYWLTFPFRVWREWSCVRKANAVTVVYPDMKTNLCKFFHIDPASVHVCLNGFDEEEIAKARMAIEEQLPEKSDQKSFTIGYFGKLMYYDSNYTRMFFGAMDRLRSSGMNVRMLHIGPSSGSIEKLLERDEYHLSSWYRCTGLMDYGLGVANLSKCNAFYLEYIAPEGPGTKIFDYIYLNKPVVALVKPGIAMERFLGRFDGAFICHSEEEIEEALRRVIGGEKSLLLNENERVLYSRRAQNEKLEMLLNEITK